MNLPAPDLDDAADRHRLVTAQIEHSLQYQVGIQARGTKGSRVTGLECQRDKDARVKRAMMIGISRQDKMVGQDLGITGWRFGHVHQIRGLERKLRR